MTGAVVFFVPGRPFVKQRPRFGKGRTYADPETVAAEDALWFYARRAVPAGFVPFDRPVEVLLDLRFALPASWSARKRADKAGGWHGSKPDWDNVAKMIDAFNPKTKGVLRPGLWTDDALVARAVVEKRWEDDLHPEGTTVTVKAL